jgi:tetratricopeptide (TPR) repeat protein
MITRLLILLFTCSSLSGQIPVDSLFKIAEKHYEEENVDSAYTIYKTIVDNYKSHKAYSTALYNLTWAAMDLKKYDVAEKGSLELLHSDYDDYEKGPGEGLMAEPYALYKHRACKILSNIYLQKAEYKSALKYEKLADKKYPYRHFCGNELAANEIYKSTAYARCYAGLGKRKKAIKIALKEAFNSSFADNSIVIALADSFITTEYGKEKIMNELQKSTASLKIKSNGKYETFYVRIFDNTIEIKDDIDLFFSEG